MAEFFLRALLAVPLLYIGFVMLRDPAGSYQLLNLTAVGIRNIENRVRQQMRVVTLPEPQPLSRWGRVLLRCMGAALIVLAIAYMAA